MSNLYKYIQTINESNDSDSDQTAIEYEKYIYLGFKYLKQKTEFQQKELLKREEEINKEDLVKTLGSIQQIDDNVIREKITKISELTKNYKEIGKSSRMQSKEKKIAKEEKFNEIKKLSIELVIDIKDQIEKNGKSKQITQSQYIKELTKKLERKLKDIEEIEILNKLFSEDENINDDYKNALFICKHFLWTVVSRKDSKDFLENENLFDINKYNILEVEHIGGQHFPIHENWKKLYPTDKPALEDEEEELSTDETDRNLYNKKGTTKSVGKTDIFLNINNQNYNLSLKNINAQLATPTYVDIYILFMYGIDALLRRILNLKKIIGFQEKDKKDLLKTISDQAEDIIKNMETDRRTYINKLKDQISITEKKTNEYITNVTCAMLFELFVQKMKSFNEELNKENNQAETIENRMREYLQKNKISHEIKSHMEDVAKDLDRLFIDIKNISSIDNMDDKLKFLLEDDIKEIKKDQKENEELLKSLTEKQTERRNKIKGPMTSINIDSLKDEIKLLLLEFKTLPLLKDRLKKLDIDKSEDRYNKTFESIKRLLKGQEKDGKFIKEASKEDEYELAFNLKDSTKKANNQFIDFFQNDNENIFEILGNLDEIHSDLKRIILKNKKIIKEEILKEAITGLYKFTGSNNFKNSKRQVATYIFEFDHEDKKHLTVTSINSSSKLKNFIRSLNINNDKIFNFAVKGSGSKSYIALRIKAIFKKITHENISYDDLNYEYDIYTEGFITNLVDKVKENIDTVFDTFKIKVIKNITSLKGKTNKLLNLFGLEVKVDKNMKLPKWIVDKL